MQTKMKKQGILAGISLIVMAIAAGFSFGLAHSTLVSDAPSITMQNLLSNKQLFYGEIAGWVVILITDIIVSIALYQFFKSTAKNISLLSAAIRLIYSLVLGIAIFQLVKIIPSTLLTDPVPENIVAETSMHFQSFEKIWSSGLIIFGFHLLGLAYLAIKSDIVPKIIGYLLYLSGVSYVFIHGSKQFNLLKPETVTSIESVLSAPMAIAEMALAIWLIYYGLHKLKS